MNKGITVNQLLNACKKEVENGNGEKIDVRKLQNLFHDKQRAEDVVILG